MGIDARLETRINQLYSSSKDILTDCALPNGAIVAANTDLPAYPSTAENYRFSWARDAAFQLLAARAINPGQARDRTIHYAKWLTTQVQDFDTTGLFIKRYGTNGTHDIRYGEQYQPDQAGAILTAFDEIIPESHKTVDTAIQKLANGLTNKWNGAGFGPTQDLWENRETTSELGDVFAYSTAAALHGLKRATARFTDTIGDTDKWADTSTQMATTLQNVTADHHQRLIYTNPAYTDDNMLDASLSGLVYPFDSANHSPQTVATISAIGKELYTEGQGVHRYKGDTYDGIVRTGSREATAGAWPLLTFWHSITLAKIGENQRAHDIFMDTIERLDYEYRADHLPNNLIPEQLFPDNERQGKGVLPLAWSHAKFVLAAHALRLIT